MGHNNKKMHLKYGTDLTDVLEVLEYMRDI